MKWVAKKEVAELAPVLSLVLVGMAILGAVLVPERYALESYLWSSALAGLLLGLTQAFLDHRAEADAFLRHRAISSRDVRIARTAGGLIAVIAAVALPWVFLLLIPGRHGYDVWGVRFEPAARGDLSLVHAPLALGIAVTFWSLARLGGAVRRAAVRPLTALLLPGLALLGVMAGDPREVLVLVSVVPIVAVLGVVFPARETGGQGVARLVAPSALLGLVVLSVPLLDAVRWLRMPLRYALEDAYPRVLVSAEGDVILRRTTHLRDGSYSILDRDPSRERVLYDGPSDAEGVPEADFLGLPARFESMRERRLHSGWLWKPPSHRGLDVVLGLVSPVFISSGELGFRVMEPKDGRLFVRRSLPIGEDGLDGSIGPSAYVKGEPPEGAERFSESAFYAGHDHPGSMHNGAQIAIVDPERRSVTFVTRVQRDDPAEVEFDVVECEVPGEYAGAISGLRQLRYSTLRPGLPDDHRDVMTLLVGDDLVFLEDGSAAAKWSSVPLPAAETLWFWHRQIHPEAPFLGTVLGPYRDTATHVRVRVRPPGATDVTTTDFVLSPQDPLEHGAAALFGILTAARPPVLNAVSFALPAATSWEELEGRWWLDGGVAAGSGIGWLVVSLLVGVGCALRNRKQGALRCQDAGERTAWTAVGLLLGPVGVVWMEMLVRKSAVRTAPGGMELAVHVPADWPAPEKTGREVLV